MIYTPIESFAVLSLREVRVPAIAFHLERDDVYLLTGGDDPRVVRLNGELHGSAFKLSNAGQAGALVFTDVMFEVDRSSSFKPAYIDQPLGALIKHSGGLEVVATERVEYGFDEARQLPIGKWQERGVGQPEIGFAKWRAVQILNGERFEVLEFEATHKADR